VICGKSLNGHSMKDTCRLCGRDICDKHKVTSPDYDYRDLCRTYICRACKKISAKYYRRIDKLELEHRKKENIVRKEMRKACEENISDKKRNKN